MNHDINAYKGTPVGETLKTLEPGTLFYINTSESMSEETLSAFLKEVNVVMAPKSWYARAWRKINSERYLVGATIAVIISPYLIGLVGAAAGIKEVSLQAAITFVALGVGVQAAAIYNLIRQGE